ncbi:MAG: hypothetical protein AAFQ74_17750 [Cyanobacteria bacterium J06623_4]
MATRFVENVQAAFSGEAPWHPIEFPTTTDIGQWLAEFPDKASQSKAPGKREGTRFGDLSIIKDFEKTCRINYMSEVLIWSLDQDLLALHYQP